MPGQGSKLKTEILDTKFGAYRVVARHSLFFYLWLLNFVFEIQVITAWILVNNYLVMGYKHFLEDAHSSVE